MTGRIYVLQSADGSGPIKIGHTNGRVADRVQAHQSSSPVFLNLIGSVAAPASVERALHIALQDYRHHGEWLNDCAKIRAVIEALLDGEFSEVEWSVAARRLEILAEAA